MRVPVDSSKLDPGIRRVVTWLRSLDFATTDSGDGVTKPAAGIVEALTEPHVFMVLRPSDMVTESHRLHDALVARGILPEPIGTPGGVWIQTAYDPSNESATLTLLGLDDSRLEALHAPAP